MKYFVVYHEAEKGQMDSFCGIFRSKIKALMCCDLKKRDYLWDVSPIEIDLDMDIDNINHDIILQELFKTKQFKRIQ